MVDVSPHHTSAMGRCGRAARRQRAVSQVPSLVGFCALVWPAREAARPVTIVSGHLCDQRGRYAKWWNENSSDTEADARGAEERTGYIQFRARETTIVQQTSMLPAYYMQEGCNRPWTSPELPQWNPLASLVTLCTVNFLNNCYAVRSSPNGSLVPSAPSHI